MGPGVDLGHSKEFIDYGPFDADNSNPDPGTSGPLLLSLSEKKT